MLKSMNQQRLKNLKTIILPILEKYEIRKAGLFGSAARGELNVQDLDILVQINRRISLLDFIGIQQELEDALKMKVDLVEYDSIKPSLKDHILSEEVAIL